MADTEQQTSPPFRRQAVDVKELDDGSILLRSPYAISTVTLPSMAWLDQWSDLVPDRPFIQQQAKKTDVLSINYAGAKQRVAALAKALSSADKGRPLVNLSENSMEAALVQLAAMAQGIPIATLTPDLGTDAGKNVQLQEFLAALKPQIVFAADAKQFAPGLTAAQGQNAKSWVAIADKRMPAGTTSLEDVMRPGAGADMPSMPNSLDAARIQFAGDAASPNDGYVTTFAMRTAFQSGLAQLWPFLSATPPVLLDRIPWHHPVGANLVLDLVLRNGGTLLVPKPDESKPLRVFAPYPEMSPTLHIDTAVGLRDLLNRMARKRKERAWFFQRLELVLCIDEQLSSADHARLIEMSQAVRGRAPMVGCAIGTAATTAVPTLLHFETDATSNIGLPMPETFIKMAPGENGYQVHVKGPTVSPGFWRNGATPLRVIDDDGFIATGLSVEFVDPVRPFRGLQRTTAR